MSYLPERRCTGGTSSRTDIDQLIVGARMFDGVDDHTGCDQAVAISGGKILGVGPASVLRERHPGIRTDHYPDATILPGFIDTHVHLTMPGDGTSYENAAGAGPDARRRIAESNLRSHLAGGVTTVRDLGSHLDFLDWTATDSTRLPRMIRYGPPITAERGHMFLFGGGVKQSGDAAVLVNRSLERGGQGVKIASSGGGTIGTVPHLATIGADIVRTVVDVAHAHGKLVTTHALSLDSMRTAIEAGTDGIEHLGFLDPKGRSEFSPELADLAIENHVVFGSTIGCNDRFTQLATAAQTAPRELVEQKQRTSYYLRNAGLLRARGAELSVASDAGWKHTRFGDFGNELRLLTEAGYSCVDALRRSTGFNADYLRLSDRVGYLKPGMDADICVLGGNPMVDMGATGNVLAVYRDGTRVDQP